MHLTFHDELDEIVTRDRSRFSLVVHGEPGRLVMERRVHVRKPYSYTRIVRARAWLGDDLVMTFPVSECPTDRREVDLDIRLVVNSTEDN